MSDHIHDQRVSTAADTLAEDVRSGEHPCRLCTVPTDSADGVCTFCQTYPGPIIDDDHGSVAMTPGQVYTVPAYRDNSLNWVTGSDTGRVALFTITRGSESKQEVAVSFGRHTEFLAVETTRDLIEALQAALGDAHDDCTPVFSEVAR
ncbi:hypothetical protein [Mycolicibacterium fortuitum]|uniref:hypothetical protein n=1 Tax=Mycolicibacterium fortuitum TaxID=1766 RepID=UPI00148F742B|nr:hypothetical protein [Mycolicibacterium fortuitum]